MTRLTTTCAMALALALPAAAQEAAEDGAARTDVTAQSTVRYITRDADGNVVFDSEAAGAANAPGPSTGEMAQAISQADGATIGETDALGGDLAFDAPSTGVIAGPRATGTLSEGESMSSETAEAMTEAGAGGAADSFTAEMAAQAVPDTGALGGDASSEGIGLSGSPDIASAGGVESVPFDVEAFATEMFEQGYRQGYVRAMGEIRAQGIRRMQQRLDAGQFQDRERFRQQAQDTRRGMTRDVLTFRDAQGNRMRFVLPEGMSRAEFLRQIDQ